MLSFGNEADRTEHTEYSSKAEIKDYNVMINGRNIFDQLIGNNVKKIENIGKIATGQRDDHTNILSLLQRSCMLIAVDLSKHQALDAD